MSFDYEKYGVIEIDVSIKLQQTIRVIHPDYTVEDVIEGLDDGSLYTTFDHQGIATTNANIIDSDDKVVAIIGSQKALEQTVHHVCAGVDQLEEELLEQFLPDE